MSASFTRCPDAEQVTLLWSAVETGRALTDDPQAVADALTAWLTEDELDVFAEAVGIACRKAGTPVPPMDGLAAEAALWADWASPEEIKAYFAACWHRLPQKNRHAFAAKCGGRHGS